MNLCVLIETEVRSNLSDFYSVKPWLDRRCYVIHSWNTTQCSTFLMLAARHAITRGQRVWSYSDLLLNVSRHCMKSGFIIILVDHYLHNGVRVFQRELHFFRFSRHATPYSFSMFLITSSKISLSLYHIPSCIVCRTSLRCISCLILNTGLH